MKRSLNIALVLVLVLCTAASAYARNVYGYIFGLGSSKEAIRQIVLTDVTAGPTYGRRYYADGWGWNLFAPGGLRWYKNGLPENHAYFVDVCSNGMDKRYTGFFLSSGSFDHKAPDIWF
jgi:hypothetical protein